MRAKRGAVKGAVDFTANLGTAADNTRPIVAVGAIAAGASRALSSPLATSYLARQAANALSKLGRVGTLSAQAGVAYDVVNGDYQSALYDTVDYFAYKSLADAGSDGAIETAGGSVAAAATLSLLYYNAGGSRGIVQGLICGE